MPITTQCKRYKKAVASNSTNTAFATLGVSSTHLIDPETNVALRSGIHRLDIAAGAVDTYLICQPFGTTTANQDFYLQVTRWSVDWNAGAPLYIPSAPFIVQCTLGASVATGYGASNLLCDTIALVRGDATAKIISPANDERAEFWLDLGGAEYVEFEFDINAGASACVSANALWKEVS